MVFTDAVAGLLGNRQNRPIGRISAQAPARFVTQTQQGIALLACKQWRITRAGRFPGQPK